MTCPDWLTQRGGAFKLGSDGVRWYVLFAGAPNYSLAVVPVNRGKCSCVIRHTISGARIESTGAYPTETEALTGGLGDLRKALGWG
jgi:hypothetical protein